MGPRPSRLKRRCGSLLLLAATQLVLLTAPSVLAQSGVLNSLSRAASPSPTGSGPQASVANPSIELSDTRVPYLLQGPSSPTVGHSGRPRIQNSFSQCSNLDGLDMVAPDNRLSISAVYAQYDQSSHTSVLGDAAHQGVLRIVGVGAVGNESLGASNGYFSAIQVTTTFLSFNVFSNLTYLCDHLYPTAPDPTQEYVDHSTCVYGPGQVAFEVDVPLNATYQMGTLWTQVLLIDYSQPPLVISCIEVPVSPYKDETSWYWSMIFWLPPALFLAYFVTVSFARAITAATTRARAFKNRAREGSNPSFLRDHLNPVIISALSGQGMVLSPALLRFSTPGCWDVLFHLQFVAMLAMLAINWPDFSYPFFRQAAWASLLGNVTLISRSSQEVISPLVSNATLPAGAIGLQMSNASSPFFMDASVPQAMLTLGANSQYTGIPAYATMMGLDTSLLFATCVAIWLIIVAIFLVVAILGWIIDSVALAATKIRRTREDRLDYQLANADGFVIPSRKEGELFMDADGNVKDARSSYYGFLGAWPRGFHPSPHLHWAALHGNIVRAVVMFHLPITILSVNQFANASENAFSTKSVILSSLAFAVISVLLPAYLIWRITTTSARKLYDDIETLLALGPVYNTFSPGSQLFYSVTLAYSLVAGVVVGASQRSGSAQAIILLVLEVSQGLASMLWLPWGEGAMMGPLCFFTSVIRVGCVILAVLLTPIVGLSERAAAWVTYVVLLLNGIYFGVVTLVLFVKVLEGLIRLLCRVPYDEKLNARSGGMGGALRMMRRRRLNALQLSNPKRTQPGRRGGGPTLSYMSGSTGERSNFKRSGSLSGRSSLMLVGNEGYPTNAQANIPLSRSRQASFASYLDFANAVNANATLSGRNSTPLSPVPGPIGARSNSVISPGGDFFTSASPFPNHLGHDHADKEKRIPMPSRSPAEPSVPPVVGFERVAGRRVVDRGGGYTVVGEGEASERQKRSASGNAAAEMSSTAAAASFARAQSRREARRAGSSRARTFFGRKDHSEDDHFTSEDEDNLGGTWGTSTLSTQHGPWNGLAKMQAALSTWKEKLSGSGGERKESEGKAAMLGGISEEGGTLPPGPPGGFQVIRAMPRGKGAGSSATPSRLPMDGSNPRDGNDGLLDSTGMAAMTASSRPSSSQAQNTLPSGPYRSRGDADEERRGSLANDLTGMPSQNLSSATTTTGSGSPRGASAPVLPTSAYDPSAAFGILGADLARALTTSSSEDHVQGESGARGGSSIQRKARDEERFWRPPNRSGGGEGVFAAAPALETTPTALDRPVPRSPVKIELMDAGEGLNWNF